MTQEERRLETRKNILIAAQKLFAAQGFTGSGVEDICRQAGITKGAFYHHFDSKQELLLEILDHWIDIVSLSIDPQGIKKTSSLNLLLDIIDTMEPSFARSKDQLPVFLELFMKGLKDSKLKKINQRSYNKFVDFFAIVVSQGMEQGSIKTDDAREAAKILFSLTMGFLIQGLLDPMGEDWPKLTKKSIRMLLS